MTTPSTTPKRGSTSWSWADIMDRIRWPHAAIILGVVAGVVAILLLAPDTTIGHIIRAIGLLTGTGGVFGTVSRAGVLRAPEELPPPAAIPARPVPRRDERREGHVTMELMLAIVAVAYVAARSVYAVVHYLGLLAFLLVLGATPGCGPSALAIHVRAATVATAALEQVPEIVERVVEHHIESECGLAAAGDVACVEALQLRMAPDLAVVDLGVIAVREPLTAYVATLRLLADADAGGDPDVIGALVSMAGRVAHVWPELVAALRALGADLPIPPLLELATALVGGAS